MKVSLVYLANNQVYLGHKEWIEKTLNQVRPKAVLIFPIYVISWQDRERKNLTWLGHAKRKVNVEISDTTNCAL